MQTCRSMEEREGGGVVRALAGHVRDEGRVWMGWRSEYGLVGSHLHAVSGEDRAAAAVRRVGVGECVRARVHRGRESAGCATPASWLSLLQVHVALRVQARSQPPQRGLNHRKRPQHVPVLRQPGEVRCCLLTLHLPAAVGRAVHGVASTPARAVGNSMCDWLMQAVAQRRRAPSSEEPL